MALRGSGCDTVLQGDTTTGHLSQFVARFEPAVTIDGARRIPASTLLPQLHGRFVRGAHHFGEGHGTWIRDARNQPRHRCEGAGASDVRTRGDHAVADDVRTGQPEREIDGGDLRMILRREHEEALGSRLAELRGGDQQHRPMMQDARSTRSRCPLRNRVLRMRTSTPALRQGHRRQRDQRLHGSAGVPDGDDVISLAAEVGVVLAESRGQPANGLRCGHVDLGQSVVGQHQRASVGECERVAQHPADPG